MFVKEDKQFEAIKQIIHFFKLNKQLMVTLSNAINLKTNENSFVILVDALKETDKLISKQMLTYINGELLYNATQETDQKTLNILLTLVKNPTWTTIN